jgi:putative endonuclease
MGNRETGERAEEEACRFLRESGYAIVARNWRSPFGEIDIIARDGSVLVFVEVKARSSASHGGPECAVDQRKQRRIIASARLFLAKTRCDLPARFDVVAFVRDAPRLYRDAFQVERG